MQQGLSTRPLGNLRIYACGGGGINLGKEYVTAGRNAGDSANIDVCFVDTSDSNMEDRLADKTWLFDKLDGSGARREANVEAIRKATPDILRKFPAGDVNVVVFTLAGGTGSVAGISILSALLEADKMVVAVVVGAKHSGRNAENTINAVVDLDAIRQKANKPVVIHLGINSSKAPTDPTVDNEAHIMISSLAALASRRNHGLDTADLRSLFDFTVSTNSPAQLCRIHVTNSIGDFDKIMASGPLASAYLLTEKTSPLPELFVPYSTYGILPQGDAAKTSLFFGIENGSMTELFDLVSNLQKEVEQQQQQTAAAALSFSGLAKKSLF